MLIKELVYHHDYNMAIQCYNSNKGALQTGGVVKHSNDTCDITGDDPVITESNLAQFGIMDLRLYQVPSQQPPFHNMP